MSINEYKRFFEKWKAHIDILTIYIAEAHFVEKDEKGKIVGGWPIGRQFNYPQHKSLEDRINMTRQFIETYDWPIHTVVDTMDNDFNRVYAVWPDRAYLIFKERILYKAMINDDGTRNTFWSKEIEALLE